VMGTLDNDPPATVDTADTAGDPHAAPVTTTTNTAPTTSLATRLLTGNAPFSPAAAQADRQTHVLTQL
jgi:hypothetical protein